MALPAPKTMSEVQLEQSIRTSAKQAGFDLCGIAALGEGDLPELEHFPAWIESGHAGTMDYLKAKHDDGCLKRASLKKTAPWARSVIVCAKNYNTAQPYSTESGNDPTKGWIARYAWSREDYHHLLLARLRQMEAEIVRQASSRGEPVTTRCYVDTGPLVERVYARHAGIGWIGKNTCIINERERLGSWLFLGVILTSLELAPSLPAADRCGSCTRCLEACPTQAFTGPYQLDARRCISYLTIEHRGSIPEELRAGMGRHVFGCDICQDVCPWNRREQGRAPANEAHELQERPELVDPALEWLAQMSEEEYRTVFKGSPVKRARRSGLRRNAAVAMGNSGEVTFVPVLQELVLDSDPLVAEHARWGLKRLRSQPGHADRKHDDHRQ
jgi:epoxyqueuosine reductase